MWRHWTRLKTFLDRLDGVILLGVSALLVAGYLLLITVNQVTGGESDRFDLAVVHYIARFDAPAWFEEMMRDCTAVGGPFVLTLVTVAVGTVLALRRQYHALLFLLLAIIGAGALSLALKGLFHRDRPMILEHRSHTLTSSFPSGHAMLSAAVWLTLAVLLARLEKSWFMKTYLIGVGLLISFFVGISRVWLGVHWPTDVLAGWMAGSMWAVLCFFFIRHLQRRGQVEAPTARGN